MVTTLKLLFSRHQKTASLDGKCHNFLFHTRLSTSQQTIYKQTCMFLELLKYKDSQPNQENSTNKM